MTATPENAAEWRELADQLTADQIADLRDQERNPRNRGGLVWQARRCAEDNLAELLFAHLPAPAGALNVSALFLEGMRCWSGARRDAAGGNWAGIVGAQYADGRVKREIVVHLRNADALTPQQARELAAALIAAADEADEMASHDQITAS